MSTSQLTARQLGRFLRASSVPGRLARGLRVLNLRTMAQEHEWQTLILVTDAFHTRRAARTFRALLPGVTFCRRALRSRFGVRDASYNTGFYWANYGIRPF